MTEIRMTKTRKIQKHRNMLFCGGFQRGTYSAVLRNIHGDDTSFEALYAVLALQMLPHAVGFSKEPPLVAEGKKSSFRVLIGLALKKNLTILC
jgi:hypothetical protein